MTDSLTDWQTHKLIL